MTRDSSICGTEHSFCRAGGFVKGFRLSGDKVRSHQLPKAWAYLDSKLNELEARHSHEGLHGCAWQNPRKSIALATVGDLEGPSLHLVSPDFPTVSEFWMDLASSHHSVHHFQKANLRG